KEAAFFVWQYKSQRSAASGIVAELIKNIDGEAEISMRVTNAKCWLRTTILVLLAVALCGGSIGCGSKSTPTPTPPNPAPAITTIAPVLSESPPGLFFGKSAQADLRPGVAHVIQRLAIIKVSRRLDRILPGSSVFVSNHIYIWARRAKIVPTLFSSSSGLSENARYSAVSTIGSCWCQRESTGEADLLRKTLMSLALSVAGIEWPRMNRSNVPSSHLASACASPRAEVT